MPDVQIEREAKLGVIPGVVFLKLCDCRVDQIGVGVLFQDGKSIAQQIILEIVDLSDFTGAETGGDLRLLKLFRQKFQFPERAAAAAIIPAFFQPGRKFPDDGIHILHPEIAQDTDIIIMLPVGNGLISVFAANVFKTGAPTPSSAFLPFLIACIATWLVGLIFVKDYPEQCGAYRDNDRSFTPEMAKKMMLEEIENKKTTVWTTGHTLSNRDFWFISIVCGFLLMFSVGMMTQTATIVAQFETLNYTMVMMLIMVFGIIGSYILGVIDTWIGTKKAIAIAVIVMILSGIFGVIPNAACLIVSLILLAVFMGASSNFTVSAAAQYWRREDFSSVFACLNPVANIFNAIAPTVIAFLLYTAFGYRLCFVVTAVCGAVSLVLILLFSAKHVKEVDDKYRAAAGKPLDDKLSGRK